MNVRYQERAAKVMGLYLTDYTYEELSGFAENAYGPEKFDCDVVAPCPHGGRDHPLPGAVARPHQRLQGHGPADAAPAALRRPPQDRRVQDGMHPGGYFRRHRQGCDGGLCRRAADEDPSILPQGRRVQGPGDPDGHSGRRQCGRLRRGGQLRRRPGRCKAHFLR